MDLVDRDFTAARPNQLWMVNLTYVPTYSGMVFTAFVSNVHSRRIVGWRCAYRLSTELPLDALEMALWTSDAPIRLITGASRAGPTDGGSQCRREPAPNSDPSLWRCVSSDLI